MKSALDHSYGSHPIADNRAEKICYIVTVAIITSQHGMECIVCVPVLICLKPIAPLVTQKSHPHNNEQNILDDERLQGWVIYLLYIFYIIYIIYIFYHCFHVHSVY